jgi:hypothetical protein
MVDTEQKNPANQENVGTAQKSHDELVAPFEDIKEEDFFEKDLDAAEKDYNEEDVPEREYIPMPSIFEPIPEEAQKEILSKFALKKREKEEVVAKTAQRLVNQFRALSAFRDDYVVTYNNELMQTPDDVINYLPTIIGGPAVREYLDYLLAQRKQGKEFDNEKDCTLHDRLVRGEIKECPECHGKGKVGRREQEEDYHSGAPYWTTNYYWCEHCKGKGYLEKKTVWK